MNTYEKPGGGLPRMKKPEKVEEGVKSLSPIGSGQSQLTRGIVAIDLGQWLSMQISALAFLRWPSRFSG
jgi:hypothetical protein